MSPTKSTININNKEYDASTGEPVSGHVSKPQNKRMIADVISSGHGQPKTIVKPSPPTVRKSHRPPAAAKKITKKPQRATTLMRPAVKKPVHKTEVHKKEAHRRTVSLGQPHEERLRRAKETPKSKKITKFNFAVLPDLLVKKHQSLEVKEPRLPAPKKVSSKPKQHDSWPVIDQFEKAMQEASSHLETFAHETTHSKKKRRKLAYVTVSLVALLVLGFGAYQTVPMAKVKLAGNRAGFSPSLPSYSPAGFGLSDPVAANHGEVILSYKSRSDDRGFKITQIPSSWSSQSLETNFLKAKGKEYKPVKSNGKTIYTYDSSSATWVDGGIWFNLESNAGLTNDQIVKIANGL